MTITDFYPDSLNRPRNTTCWKLGRVETFRLASAELFDYGTNLTNIEKSVRKLYWADKGKKLCQIDQAGAEALIVAYLCKPGKFRELFTHKVKPHVFVAMKMFLETWQLKCKDVDVAKLSQTPISELKQIPGYKELENLIKDSDNWSASERYYYIAKQTCHSSNYGIREDAFRMNVLEKSKGKIVLSKQKAAEYLMQYHSLFPEIHEWHRTLQHHIEQYRMMHNLQGFPYIVTSWPIADSDWKEYYAWIPQSTVGCITHDCICDMQEFIECEKLDWDILGNCHDSMLIQAPESEILDAAKKSKEFMERYLVSPRGESFQMRSECQIGFNWSPKKSDNRLGLEEIVL